MQNYDTSYTIPLKSSSLNPYIQSELQTNIIWKKGGYNTFVVDSLYVLLQVHSPQRSYIERTSYEVNANCIPGCLKLMLIFKYSIRLFVNSRKSIMLKKSNHLLIQKSEWLRIHTPPPPPPHPPKKDVFSVIAIVTSYASCFITYGPYLELVYTTLKNRICDVTTPYDIALITKCAWKKNTLDRDIPRQTKYHHQNKSQEESGNYLLILLAYVENNQLLLYNDP